MKVQRNISSAFIFIFAFIAVAYSAAYSDEDELMNQFREDFLLVKLFNRMQAREQGMTTLPLYSSPPFNPFLPGKASQQRKPSTGSMFVSPRVAWLQEKALQQFFSRLLVEDAKAMKNRLASKLNKENRVITATSAEGRVQDYIKTLNQTKLNEQAQRLIGRVFDCSIGSLPDFVESLKENRIFGSPINRLIEGYKKLRDKSSNGINFFKTFVRLVPHILDPNGLVAKEQLINFTLLRDLFKDGFKSFVDIPKQTGENETFRNLLNIASGFVSSKNLTPKGKTRFNRSINFFVERYGFKQIDGMDKSEEEKTAMKKALSGAVNTVVAAIFKMWNGEKPNPDNRISLLRSLITILVSLNNGSDDTPLFHYIDTFLARNPTKEELSIKSQCLLVIFLRKSLEYVLHLLRSDRMSVDNAGPATCAVDIMAEGLSILLEYIPTQVSNAGGCEDFAVIGYRAKGVAQLRSKDAMYIQRFHPR